MSVRARQDSDGTVVLTAIVKVQAHRDHLTQDMVRRLYALNTCFLRPRPESWGVEPLLDRDGEILVPRDLPVGLRRLVEEDATNCEALGAEDTLDNGPDRGGLREFCDLRYGFAQVANRQNASPTRDPLALSYVVEDGDQSIRLGGTEYVWNNSEPVDVHRRDDTGFGRNVLHG
jgi:hypothetical protein